MWLRYGECLNSLGEIKAAVEAYTKVVEMAPSHFGGRVSLSALQQQLGQPEEAVKALSQGRFIFDQCLMSHFSMPQDHITY